MWEPIFNSEFLNFKIPALRIRGPQVERQWNLPLENSNLFWACRKDPAGRTNYFKVCSFRLKTLFCWCGTHIDVLSRASLGRVRPTASDYPNQPPSRESFPAAPTWWCPWKKTVALRLLSEWMTLRSSGSVPAEPSSPSPQSPCSPEGSMHSATSVARRGSDFPIPALSSQSSPRLWHWQSEQTPRQNWE